jgi:myo-inositol 2-dehydrogenase/D-chiro-inositol 1-dehydrogenase
MFRDAYVQELAEFTEAVRGNTEPPVTGEDARNALRIALAAMKSHEERRPVRIEEIG